jgi:hypothetical protein
VFTRARHWSLCWWFQSTSWKPTSDDHLILSSHQSFLSTAVCFFRSVSQNPVGIYSVFHIYCTALPFDTPLLHQPHKVNILWETHIVDWLITSMNCGHDRAYCSPSRWHVNIRTILHVIHPPDDGGSTHLWNVGQLHRDYTALHPRRL